MDNFFNPVSANHTNYKAYADVSAHPALPCINALKSLAGKTCAQIKEAHIKEYQQYFNTFFMMACKNNYNRNHPYLVLF